MRVPPGPLCEGGSARRRWGREPCGGQEYFGARLAKNLMGLLRPYGWFVGNGLDRSVPPRQKYDTARKPRAAGCADGSRPIPTNIPRTPHKTNGHGRPMVAPTKNVGADSISARARLRQDKLPRAHIECAPTDFAFDQRGFVGNGLDRSVPPCQKYDTAGKPRAAGCADGSRPIPTNIPRTPHEANGHGRPMVAPTKNVGADSISARARLRQDKPPRAHIECAPTDFAFDITLAGSGRYNKKRACDILYVTDSWCAVQDSNL